MSYATQAAMVARFGEAELIQLTDRAEPPVGVVDADVLAAACLAADGIVDGHLCDRFAVPLADVPPMLVDAACDIARYKLYTGTPSDAVVSRYKASMEILARIQSGRLSPGLGAAG